jgi:hypothetical protein
LTTPPAAAIRSRKRRRSDGVYQRRGTAGLVGMRSLVRAVLSTCAALAVLAAIFAPATATAGEPPDGSFVRTPNGAIYVIAGGAPLYLSSWDAVGGPQAVTPVTDAELAALKPVPADGTVVRTSASGAVYVVAGGAPIYVSSWDAIGGVQPFVTVDPYAIEHPEDPKSHLNARPADNTLIHTRSDGRVYTVAGGAPIYVAHWEAIGGYRDTFVDVDRYSLEHPEDPKSHLDRRPRDGTFLRDVLGGRYRVAGGAALRISNCAVLGGCPGAALVDPQGFPRSLRPRPATGTVLQELPAARWWLVEDGKRRESTRTERAVPVDEAAIRAIPLIPPPAPVPTPAPPDPAPTATPAPASPAPASPAPSVPAAPVPVVSGDGRVRGGARGNPAVVAYSFERTSDWTRFTKLSVRRVPTGATIRATCRGGGCPRKRLAMTAGGTVPLTPFLRHRLLPGAGLTITISRSGFRTRTVKITVRAGKDPVAR